jgi:hypothetical protein
MTGRLVEKFSGRKTMDSPLEGLSDRELEVFFSSSARAKR